ncbi:MAG: tRNA epoxyqueuosine(34) reductase QueG [Phycisphaerae bacterium]|jgi:epoxyqueuosine reductase
MTPRGRAEIVKQLALDQGFERCGIASARRVARGAYFRSWLEKGRAGSMGYLHRNTECRVDPGVLVPGAKSVIVVALNYRQDLPSATLAGAEPTGRVAMYAWGEDYHAVVREKLEAVEAGMRMALVEAFTCRICVDTAPLLEREWAAAAGVGWIGKNTMVLHPELGSYFFLGAMATTLPLASDGPVDDHCGTCTACLDACPTAAFPAPYEMDASRCISYLTIEHRSDVPAELASRLGEWVFGCDVCQQVCPHNRHAPVTREPRFAVRPPGPRPSLRELLGWSEDDYRSTLRGSAMKRAKLDMLKRNAAIVRTNIGRGSSISTSERGPQLFDAERVTGGEVRHDARQHQAHDESDDV